MNELTLTDIFFLLPEAPDFIALAGQTWGADLPGYSLVPLFGLLVLQGAFLVMCLRAWRNRIPGMRITVPLLTLSAFGFFGATLYHWLVALVSAYSTISNWTLAVDMILESIQVVAIILLVSAVIRMNRYYHASGASTHRPHTESADT